MSLPLPGVPGGRVASPPKDTLREDGPSPPGKLPGIPKPLGVPIGVCEDLVGMLGGGGVPVYCARNIRADGDPDTLGLPSSTSGVWRKLPMFIGFVGVIRFDILQP